MKGRLRSRFLAFLTILSLTAFSNVVSQQSTRCVALITDMRGEVFVKAARSAEFKKVAWGTQLYASDVVKTSNTGAVSILMSNNNLIELGPGSSVTISEGPLALQKKSKTISGISSKNLIDLSGLTMRSTSEGELVALAGLRSVSLRPSVVLLAPRNSKIRSVTPTFSWQASSSIRKFQVKVFDKSGMLWTKETDTTSFEYPSNQKPLRPGEMYFWQVDGAGRVETYPSGNVGFNVLSESELEALAAQEQTLSADFQDDLSGSSFSFLLGTLYQQHGLLHDAIAKFEAVAQRHPEAPKAYQVLGKLYDDIGLKNKAINALQKALELSEKQ